MSMVSRRSETDQLEFAVRVLERDERVPQVRPMADADLEASFVRAATAWARWRERQRWMGR